MRSKSVFNLNGLSNSELKEKCPSIFGVQAHSSRSEKYQFVPTIDILNLLREEDYIPTFAAQTQSRSKFDSSFTKHIVRLRHKSHIGQKMTIDEKLGGVIPEIVFMNAHNGTSSARLTSGIIRLICSNGLIMADNAVGGAIRHMGEDTMDEVMALAGKVMENSVLGIDRAKEWNKKKLDIHARNTIAELAHKLRFNDDSQIKAEQLLQPRRYEDEGLDLWSTFNVIQENMMRGGLTGGGPVNGRWKSSRTNDIQAVDKLVDLNQGLWEICEQFA